MLVFRVREIFGHLFGLFLELFNLLVVVLGKENLGTKNETRMTSLSINFIVP